MGVFKFYSCLNKLFPEITLKRLQQTDNFDYLFIDFNAIIYNCLDDNINILQDKVVDKVNKLSQLAPVTYLMMDGVCSRSKQIQQRNRRYLSTLNVKNNNQITVGTEFMNQMNKKIHEK